ncbi:MAG TPA: hypothetical protein PLH94_02415 [Fimbriimonadaceae bacterium]|nr:hypothetical protein [Fimbriimonadaceae bacterium]
MPKSPEPSATRAVGADDLKRLAFRSIGPAVMSGRVATIAFQPGRPKTFYVGYATGGLWKTENLGVTFRPIFDDQMTSSIGAVAVADAPATWSGWDADAKKGKTKKELTEEGRGKIVWVGTGEGNGRNSSSWGHGVYRSTDAGGSFEHCGLADTHDIPAIAVDARNPDVCYVAALGHLWGPNKERGVYKTEDGGKNWKAVLTIDDQTGACDVVIDPHNPDIVYAAMYGRLRSAYSFRSGRPEGGIYKSIDAGKTWKKLAGGLPPTTGRIGLDIFAKNPDILYAVVESDSGGGNDIRDDRSKSGGVFRTDDGGKTWVRQSVRTPRAFYFCRIKVDPVDENRVYLLGWVVEMSVDGGKTFQGGIGLKNHVDMHALAIDPEDPEHLLNGSDGGVYQSFDRGKSWQFLNTMAVGQFYNVSVDMSDPYRVIGGLQDNGTWMGPSATNRESGKEEDGTLNTGITNAEWQYVMWGDGFHACFDPDDPNVVYAEWQGGNLVRIHLDSGVRRYLAPQQKEGGQTYRFNWNSPFFVSAHDSSVLYLGGNFVFRLTEKGDKWTVISGDLTTNDGGKIARAGSSAENHCTVVALAESELAKGLLWAGSDDGLIHVTESDGKSWAAVTPPEVGGRYISKIEASHHDRNRAYVSVDGHRSHDYDPCILATDDLGKTWRNITADLPKGWSVKCVREDRVNPDVLYCGTENALYASFDRGQSWLKLTGKTLPTVPVDDIVQHPRELDLVVGTHGRSIYILDEGYVLSQLNADVAGEALHLFDIRPARAKFMLWYQGLWTDQLFRAANPPNGATIHYWLREYTGDEVEIKVENAHGVEMQKLTGSNAPGLNKVVWDLQPHEYHRIADRGEEPFLPFPVPAGEYKVTVTCGKLKATKSLTVLPSPYGR